MKYRVLGASGLRVSRISLGTMTFGAAPWGCDEAEAHAILQAYLDAGGNFVDAADVYAGGKAEEFIGSFLPRVPRDRVLLASKCYFPMGTGPNSFGVSRHHVLASCEASLRRLRTEYLDLYYIHGPDPVTPYEETLRALDDLVRQGKVRYLGCSNLPEDVWTILEERTRPTEEYLTWFTRMSYDRFKAAAEFPDERAELP